jgi:cell division protein FtsW
MKWVERRLDFDIWLLASVLALSFFGLLMVYSTSFALSMEKFGNPYHYFEHELVYLFVGLLGMAAAMHFNHERWRHFGTLFMALALAGLVAVFFFGSTRGAHRWLRYAGFQFQPSELAKFAVILYFAHSLDKRQAKLKSFWSGLVPYMGILGLYVGLVMLEPDFGGAMSIALLGVILLFTAGVSMKYLAATGAAALPVGLYFLASEEYRFRRLVAFMDPWQYSKDYAFQLIQSFLAFGNGGWVGVGLGMGHQKLFYLPDAHTDFIFSVIAEEWGWVGVMAVIAVFVLFITRGAMAAIFAPNHYSSYLAMGVTAMIGLPAVINMAVVTGLLPTKGLVLPFLSYGGSSLLINLFAAGILLNISAKRFRA